MDSCLWPLLVVIRDYLVVCRYVYVMLVLSPRKGFGDTSPKYWVGLHQKVGATNEIVELHLLCSKTECTQHK